MLMKMDRDDSRADERGSTAEEPAPDDAGEASARPLRLTVAWRLPVILSAAAAMDDDADER